MVKIWLDIISGQFTNGFYRLAGGWNQFSEGSKNEEQAQGKGGWKKKIC